MYNFTSDYLTGIALVDEEHAHLFELANQAYSLLKEEYLSDKYDQIIAILEELKEYTKTHFRDEEEYMESIDYEAIFIQKAQHKMFIEKLGEVNLDVVDENQDEMIEQMLTFLTNWLFNHILKLDKLIGK
ncbi:MAG: hemerythrin family protein [Lachnospiraceae bacterium]|nr:hemerythrin family protein [Lachnospiraceae bacterium]